MLRYWTAGESHGQTLVAIVDGFPSGVPVDVPSIDAQLKRRQGGYGRGGRQRIESDRVTITSGLWKGRSIGSPITLQLVNRDAKLEEMSDLSRPRPGHGDLAGAVKFLGPMRAILERASARETAARVAAGALARQLFAPFGIRALAYVIQLGPLKLTAPKLSWSERVQRREVSVIDSLCPERDAEVTKLIDETGKAGDTLGGIVEVTVEGVPFGLGSHTQWDRKLDGRIAQAVMSVQAIKGVEIGLGVEAARRVGSKVHDPIAYDPTQIPKTSLGYVRPTNHAGGIEAGISNSQPVVVRAAMKPISTLRKPLGSINLETKEPAEAEYERSDVCAVSAASVIVENVVAFEIARALVEKFGGDSLTEMKKNWETFHELARQR